MNYLDGIIILLILFWAVRGYRQGLIKALAGLVGMVAAIFLAWKWSPSLVTWLDEKYNLQTALSDRIVELLPLPQAEAGMNPNEVSVEQWSELLAETGLPLALREGLISYWETNGMESVNSFAQAAAMGLGAILLKILVFVVLLIALVILIRIIANLFTAGISHTFLGSINRMAGFVLGGVTITVVMGLVLNIAIPLITMTSGALPEPAASSALVPKLSSLYGVFSSLAYQWL